MKEFFKPVIWPAFASLWLYYEVNQGVGERPQNQIVPYRLFAEKQLLPLYLV